MKINLLKLNSLVSGLVLAVLVLPSGVFAAGSLPSVFTTNPTNLNSQNMTAYFYGNFNPNGDDTYVWFEYGTSSSLGHISSSQYIGKGNQQIQASVLVSNLYNGTNYYRSVARNSNGTVYGGIISFNLNSNYYGTTPTPTPGTSNSQGSPTATTSGATNITNVRPGSRLGSAQLHGTIRPNGAFTTAWFEYGTSPSLGKRTGDISIGANISTFENSAVVLNLKSGTHYFRAVSRNEYGVSQGSISSFQIQTETVSGTISGNSGGSTSSSAGNTGNSGSYGNTSGGNTSSNTSTASTAKDGNFFAAITGNSDKSKTNLYVQFVRDTNSNSDNSATVISSQDAFVNAGEPYRYAVLIRNNSEQKLDKVNFKITLPAEAEFNFSNIEPADNSGGYLRYEIGALNPGESKELVIDVDIKSNAVVGKHLVFSSILEYLGRDGKIKSVTSYSTALVEGVAAVAQGKNWFSTLFATISSFFSFLWLSVLLLLALAGYLFYLYRRNRKIILDEINKSSAKMDPQTPVSIISSLPKPESNKTPDNLPGFPTGGAGEPLRYRPNAGK